jgi:hypothetical protein
MCREEYEAAIEAFVRSNGITRCPTANALSSQGSLAAADRAALLGRRYHSLAISCETYPDGSTAFSVPPNPTRPCLGRPDLEIATCLSVVSRMAGMELKLSHEEVAAV